MSLFRKAPQKGAKNRPVHFPFCTTPRGYSWEAFIAGPCHWFDCHDLGRSKPCLHCITNGELHCDRNHDIDEPVEIGYQPLWQKDTGRPCLVIVYEFAREQIDKLQLHHLVCVARGKGKADTVSINYKGLNSPRYQSTRADFMRPVDLTETLLRIWKIPELVAWVRSKNGQSYTPPPEQAKLTGEAYTKAVVTAAKQTFKVKPAANYDGDRKSTRLNSSHRSVSRMPSSA